MYEELVKRLRCEECLPYFTLKTMREAADAIEELESRIARAIDLYNRNVEKTAMYEALAGISPEPPKEET